MKKILAVFFFIFSISKSLVCLDPVPVKSCGPITIENLYLSQNQTANPEIKSMISLENLSKLLLDLQSSSEIVKSGNVKQNLNFFKANSDNVERGEKFLQSLSLLGKSKKFWLCTIGASSLALYGYMFYKLKSLEIFLTKSDLWSFWKNERSFTEIASMLEKDFIEQLLLDIQVRYTSVRLINDFSTPLSAFFKSVDLEIQNLELYLWLCKKVKLLHLVKIFPINEKIIQSGQERLNKLAFLKNKTWTWISRQKVFSNIEKMGN